MIPTSNSSEKAHLVRAIHGLLVWVLAIGGFGAIAFCGLVLELDPLGLGLVGAAVSGLLLVLLAIKKRSQWFTEHPSDSPKPALRRWSLTAQLLWISFVPTALFTFILSLSCERSQSEAKRALQLAGFSKLKGVLLPSESASTKDAQGKWILGLAGFDQAVPFAYLPKQQIRHGIDRDDALAIKRAIRNRADHWISEKGYGFAFRRLNDETGVVGIRFLLSDSQSSTLLVVATLLIVAFGSGLITLWGHSSLIRLTGQLQQRIEAIPHGKKKAGQRIAPKEVAAIDDELEKLEKRFFSMHSAQIDAIETGHHAREMKAQFFAGMSHDLRSPLNSVIGFAEILLKGIDGPIKEEQKKAIVSIAQEAERLIVLIADILDTSKLKAGRLELERSWVPPIEILTECEAAARRLLGNRQIKLLCEFQPGLPPVFVDKGRVRQALLDLISRALDSMGQGTLKIKASKEMDKDAAGGLLRVDIIDHSQAISADQRERFGMAYHAVEGLPLRSDAGALSLGIALARDIIHLHGGKLSVKSERERGAIFAVVLPLDET